MRRRSPEEMNVRSAVDRAFLPAKSLFEQVGDMMILTARTLVSAVKPPYPYGEEFIGQFLFALQLCWFPLLVSTVAFGFGAPGLQAANFLSLFGALDRLGGFFVLASIREFAPFVTAIILAGVGGTAITADLGARKIREELDAMMVLGIDPIQRLVVPRVLACMMVAVFLNGLVSVVGVAGGYVFNVVLQDGTPGAYVASFTALAQLPDLWIGLFKALVFGLIAAVVASYKGMNAGGGPKGVGDAVNESVVITFLLLFVANFVLSMIYLQVVPPKGG
jgi:phospholipid/cholesterol/gamma-HCH transport system permease protein